MEATHDQSAAIKETMMEMVLVRLAKTSDSLMGAADRLCGRLERVSRPEDPVTDEAKAGARDDHLPELHSRIDAVSDTLAATLNRLESILERPEI